MTTMKVSSPDRAEFGFAAAALAEFSFVSEFGLVPVEQDEKWSVNHLRFESQRRSVNIHHGYWSYEVRVEVGRWIEIGGARHEQAFSLGAFTRALAGHREWEGGPTAINRDQLLRQLHRRAAELRPIAHLVLVNGDDVFERVSANNAAWATAYTEGMDASRLRARADAAWHRRDLETVIAAYQELDSTFTTITLLASERAKLNYARKHVERS
jgi:hypothetical protein